MSNLMQKGAKQNDFECNDIQRFICNSNCKPKFEYITLDIDTQHQCPNSNQNLQ